VFSRCCAAGRSGTVCWPRSWFRWESNASPCSSMPFRSPGDEVLTLKRPMNWGRNKRPCPNIAASLGSCWLRCRRSCSRGGAAWLRNNKGGSPVSSRLEDVVPDHQPLKSAIGAEAISSMHAYLIACPSSYCLPSGNKVQPPSFLPGSICHLPPHRRLTAQEALTNLLPDDNFPPAHRRCQ
jgi:hypothetical protein